MDMYLFLLCYTYICMFLGLSGISTVDEFVPFPISTAIGAVVFQYSHIADIQFFIVNMHSTKLVNCCI